MSGKSISPGLSTNKGLKQLDIDPYFNKKIKEITIQVIPWSINDHFLKFQFVGMVLKTITLMVINLSLTHITIQI